MYYNQVPMLTHWRHMHDWESFVDAQVTRQEADMTGIWRGNDGGVYYIRHDDPHVWWAGFSDNGRGQHWTHVFHGMRMFDETGSEVISGNWADVPRGTNRGSGTLVVARSGDRLTKVSGGIGATTWQRIRY
ncbi:MULTISPECIES: hypothetical protein [Bacillus]|uniref:hypothetical protein n=1 Tax=Bacillus TaxID=1386 RepID=UPI000493C4E5|nr:hypothetical protein [Bacillus subtilis]CJS84902.1 Uncharacterised protein [Streptococcus pneumoniae]HWO75891.1 hypothetical protein [Bacillus sp. (in: firmicutes)]ASB91740.1 hypothetical protein S101392_00217 [Bacillus subtilis subsp. subtilis]AWM19479.1 hypothetical protein DJ572_00495 [Bacillus subtilis]KDE21716.1 hypothetical protein EF83_22125 [Bacillus subtilis]